MRSRFALLIAAVFIVAAAGQAIASSATDARANQPQIATDLSSNTSARFPTNKQNEPTIAIAPNGRNALAGANDEQNQPPCGPGPVRGWTAPANDCSFYPGVGTSGIYASSDTGTTWHNLGLLPGYTDTTNIANTAGRLSTSTAPGTIVSDGDPVIVFGPKPDGKGGFLDFKHGARAYYANLASYASGVANGNQAPELLAVSISDDLGLTWFDPILAVTSNGYVFNDKEAIWADRNPLSPNFGNVYISWTQFRDLPGCAEPIMFAYSTDAGLTWSKPNQLSAAHNCGIGGRQGSTIRTGRDGAVYVIWEDTDQLGPEQVVQVSHDGGLTFSQSITIAHLTDIADPIPGANFRTDSFASAAVDPRNGAIYVAWATRTSDGGRMVVSKSTDGAVTWSGTTTVSGSEGYAFFQGLDVAPNGRVDLAYQALTVNTAGSASTYGTGNATVNSWYVSRDPTTGAWSSPMKISSLGSDPAASSQNNLRRQFWGDYNTLASTNAAALFIYTDSRTGAGCAAVDLYQHGIDGSGLATTKPAPPTACTAQFGNTDAFVSKVTP